MLKYCVCIFQVIEVIRKPGPHKVCTISLNPIIIIECDRLTRRNIQPLVGSFVFINGDFKLDFI